jgi:hypothetical protein
MRKTLFFALALSCSDPQEMTPPAPQAQEMTPPRPAPALSHLSPGAGFWGRTVTLQIGGDATSFGKDTTVSFSDPALRPVSVAVRSPASLVVEVEIGESASFGLNDVTVRTPRQETPAEPEALTLPRAFHVLPPLSAEAAVTTATAPQGGLVDFTLRNVDSEHPFAGTPLLTSGLRPLYLTVLGGRLRGYGLVDALAPPGSMQGLPIRAELRDRDRRLPYALDPRDPAAPRITARPAVALQPGQATGGAFEPRQSQLYRLASAADNQLLVLTMQGGTALAGRAVAGALAPQSGRFTAGSFLYSSTAGATQTLLALLPRRGDHYLALVPANLGGGTGHDYTLTARLAAARSFPAAEDMKKPDSPAAPLATLTLDGPAYSEGAAFEAPGESDYLRVTVPRAGRLYVQGSTPSLHFGRATLAVALLQGDCATPIAPARAVSQEASVMMGMTVCVQVSDLAGAVETYTLLVAQDGP